MKSIKSTKSITVLVVIFLSVISPVFLPISTTYADNICDRLPSGSDVWKANGCGGGASTDLQSAITVVINGVIGVLGAVAAIFILVGAINYMTSTGDSAKVEKAKKTILWAVIGLIIAVLTFVIVNFVLKSVLNQ